MTLRPVSGISLWDLSFRGQRIVYELSLQELFIAYNSYSGAGATYFLVPPSPRSCTSPIEHSCSVAYMRPGTRHACTTSSRGAEPTYN